MSQLAGVGMDDKARSMDEMKTEVPETPRGDTGFVNWSSWLPGSNEVTSQALRAGHHVMRLDAARPGVSVISGTSDHAAVGHLRQPRRTVKRWFLTQG